MAYHGLLKKILETNNDHVPLRYYVIPGCFFISMFDYQGLSDISMMIFLKLKKKSKIESTTKAGQKFNCQENMKRKQQLMVHKLVEWQHATFFAALAAWPVSVAVC